MNLKGETHHIPKNWKACKTITVASESLMGWLGWKLPEVLV